MKTKITLIAVALSAMGMAQAAVTAEEAARLGKDLTPWGAEKAGNKEGTIPPYTGGMPVDLMGAGFDSNKSIVNGRQYQPDPFKDEKPLYRITTKNLDQYADKLSEATIALFKNDPNFYMDVYPTHRVVNYPKYYLDASIQNATRCKVDPAGQEIKGCKGGMPFPIPKTGIEAILNMQLGADYGPGYDADFTAQYTDRNGQKVITSITTGYYQYPFQDPRYSLEDYENPNNSYHNLIYRLSYARLGPPRITGEAGVLLFPADNREATQWVYQPGNRRVRSSPNVEYDFPIASSGGGAFYDEAYIIMGRKDRFDWKLLGKKEMIMPYSNYRLEWGDMNKVFMAGHPNPEYMRWELHRAWVVEATRKPGARHAYAKRRYYMDEDHPGSAMSANWDDSGRIMRGSFATTAWIWDYQQSPAYYWHCDLISGSVNTSIHPGNGVLSGVRYRNPVTTLGGLTPDGKMLPDSAYTPDALARRSQR